MTEKKATSIYNHIFASMSKIQPKMPLQKPPLQFIIMQYKVVTCWIVYMKIQ